MAPRARIELATLRLTAEEVQNLSALSGVAYRKLGAILCSLVAPNPAPKSHQKIPFTSSTDLPHRWEVAIQTQRRLPMGLERDWRAARRPFNVRGDVMAVRKAQAIQLMAWLKGSLQHESALNAK